MVIYMVNKDTNNFSRDNYKKNVIKDMKNDPNK